MHYLHEKHVLHRDIKPANVLVAASGHIKLGDFGLSTSTSRRKACGTLPYIAPEVLHNVSAATNAVDLWSVGVTLFELLTGELPFVSPEPRQPVQMLDSIMDTLGAPLAQKAAAAGLSEAAMDLTEKMLAPDPVIRLVTHVCM